MDELLIEFIDTFDVTFKKLQEEFGSQAGIARLTISQLQYVDAIHQLGEPTITEVAGRLKITRASVTVGVNRLIELGYVIKTQSSLDRRVFLVSLTDAGERLIQAKYEALKAYGAFIRSALSDEEAWQFEAAVRKIVAQFKQSTPA